MNPLEKHPHLFANGKFKVSIEQYTSMKGDIWPFTGVVDGILFLEKYNGCNLENCQLEPSICTLIARPISDMTDEEMDSLCGYCTDAEGGTYYAVLDHHEAREDLIERSFTGRLDVSELEWLNDHGFYHGPQSHFKDGTVIDTTKLEVKP